MYRVAAVVLVSIIHFAISQAAFSQYHVLPKLRKIHRHRAEELVIYARTKLGPEIRKRMDRIMELP